MLGHEIRGESETGRVEKWWDGPAKANRGNPKSFHRNTSGILCNHNKRQSLSFNSPKQFIFIYLFSYMFIFAAARSFLGGI